MLSGRKQTNVIPIVTCNLDARLLPDETEKNFAALKEVIADPTIRLKMSIISSHQTVPR
jgi:hypothetical protein